MISHEKVELYRNLAHFPMYYTFTRSGNTRKNYFSASKMIFMMKQGLYHILQNS